MLIGLGGTNYPLDESSDKEVIALPILDVKLSRIQKLLGIKVSLKELDEILFRYGMELDSYEVLPDGDYWLKIEITPDRPDMLSLWGLVRALKKYMGKNVGLEHYEVKGSTYRIIVDESVKSIRPYIASVVVKGVKLTEEDLEDLIYAQEKLHDTFCRGRKKASIGFYPFRKISWPLHYYAEDPEKIRFTPLDFDEELNAYEILEKHPTGEKYAHILRPYKKYPVFTDDEGHILSLPPIINSEDYGKITIEDSDILIETTGMHKPTVELVINILSAIMKDLGGTLFSVKIEYPNHHEYSPYMSNKKWKLKKKYVEEMLGVHLSVSEITKLLNMMGLDGKEIDSNTLEVLVPPYRADILHPIDIVDDIARAIGFDNFEPELTPIFTTSGILERTEVIDYVRELMVGLGYNEAFTFALTSFEDQFDKMRLERKEAVIISGAKEVQINTVRVWLIPELLKALTYNKNRKYPIKLFEVSDVVILDKNVDTGARNETHLAAISAHMDANFTEIRSVAEYILRNLGFREIEIRRINHPSFIEGRVIAIYVGNKRIGVLGELHPEVILNWGLSIPVAAMEISLEELMGWSYKPVEFA